MAKRGNATGRADEEGHDDLTDELIKSINAEFGLRVAYNLSTDSAPTDVKRWISTGSVQLDYMIRNASGGGFPEGRIIEITGMPSTGKSHIGYHAAANVQKEGGLVVYIDTENATPLSKLASVGINIAERFVYCDCHCTEDVFTVIEKTILKAKQTIKDVPILVVWDSIAATSPKAELEGDYDQNSMGLQARAISKGMRKITGIIGQTRTTLLCLNQLRAAIGVMHGDPHVSPGGHAVPFHASVRVRLGSGAPVKGKNGEAIGSHVTVTVKKNKVAPPFRKCEFDIIFGKGIVEHEYVFDVLRKHCSDNGPVKVGNVEVGISGTGAWKLLSVNDATTGEVIKDKKFYKADFNVIMNDPEHKPFVDAVIDAAYSIDYGSVQPLSDEEREPVSSEDDDSLRDD